MRRSRLWIVGVVIACSVGAAAEDEPAAGAPLRLDLADAERVVIRNFEVTAWSRKVKIGAESWALGSFESGQLVLQHDLYVQHIGKDGSVGRTRESSWHLREHYGVEGALERITGTVREAEKTVEFDVRIESKSARVCSNTLAADGARVLPLPENHATDRQTFKSLLNGYSGGRQEPHDYSEIDVVVPGFIEPRQMSILARKKMEFGGTSMDVYVVQLQAGDVVRRRAVDEDFMPMVEMAHGISSSTLSDDAFEEYHTGWWLTRRSNPLVGRIPWGGFLESVEVRAVFRDVGPSKFTIADSRYQQATRRDGGYDLRLEPVSMDPTMDPPPLPIRSDDDSVMKYARPTSGVESADPAVMGLARRIVGDAVDALEATKRIVSAVNRRLAKRSNSDWHESALETLTSGVGGSSDHAALTVACCRAVGIPARRVAGLEFVVTRDGRSLVRPHVWAEVYLRRWVGVDPLVPEIGTSARYVSLAFEDTTGKSSALRTVEWPLHDMEFTIEAYKRAGETRSSAVR